MSAWDKILTWWSEGKVKRMSEIRNRLIKEGFDVVDEIQHETDITLNAKKEKEKYKIIERDGYSVLFKVNPWTPNSLELIHACNDQDEFINYLEMFLKDNGRVS